MARLFGTDGVRGVANADLTPELALRIGRAMTAILGDAPPERPILVGRDTRLSGTMLEAALVAGITSTGRDTVALGVLPTPGVALLTVREGAAAGVMISASHNPIGDNGIKIFDADGFKLRDEQEDLIETALGDASLPRPTERDVGVARVGPELRERYFERLVTFGTTLAGLTIVVDAAFGAAYDVGPRALAALGATVEARNAQDDGSRINVACGSTDTTALAARVRELAASRPYAQVLGVAFDGDADRALFIDETGALLSGDHVMLVLAREKKRRGTLRRDTVIGTVMSNVGLERALRTDGIRLVRAAVGDRYVLELMRAGDYSFGGEQSGHVLDFERNTTGDGPATAVALFSLVAREETTLRELASGLHVAPQILLNVRARDADVMRSDALRAAVARVERELGDGGRILVRPSGTEPVIRVMIEGDDGSQIDRLAREVAAIVEGPAR